MCEKKGRGETCFDLRRFLLVRGVSTRSPVLVGKALFLGGVKVFLLDPVIFVVNVVNLALVMEKLVRGGDGKKKLCSKRKIKVPRSSTVCTNYTTLSYHVTMR